MHTNVDADGVIAIARAVVGAIDVATSARMTTSAARVVVARAGHRRFSSPSLETSVRIFTVIFIRLVVVVTLVVAFGPVDRSTRVGSFVRPSRAARRSNARRVRFWSRDAGPPVVSSRRVRATTANGPSDDEEEDEEEDDDSSDDSSDASRRVVMTPERCARELRDMATSTSPIVRFMLEKLADAGCAVDERFFKIEKCSDAVVGGFRPPDGIVLCHNQIHDRTTMENTVAHELIHAYDQCRAGKRMNWSDIRQHACSEVRAANLSGDCHWVNEVMRGRVFVGLKGHHRKCARRRAELSVAMNPKCKGTRHAEEIVGEVFERCFNDTAPFDDIP